MDNNNIIGTGLLGLVGSRIVELLSPKFTFTNISRRTGTDITNSASVLEAITKSPAKIVLHLAAKTHVDGCEEEKNLGENSEAWKINVVGTEHVIKACKETGKKLIYISTDMVFSGDQAVGKSYSEEDMPSPKNWYAYTKFEAEKRVLASAVPFLILRIAYPYRANFEKKEYVRIFIDLLSQKKSIAAVEDHYFTPTFIDDIASSLDILLSSNSEGIFHVTGNETVSPYIVAQKIAEEFGFDENLISKTTRSEYFKNKAERGFNLSLNNDKINKLGVLLHPFSEGLKEIKKQL